jgi:hypothetical protein
MILVTNPGQLRKKYYGALHLDWYLRCNAPQYLLKSQNTNITKFHSISYKMGFDVARIAPDRRELAEGKSALAGFRVNPCYPW